MNSVTNCCACCVHVQAAKESECDLNIWTTPRRSLHKHFFLSIRNNNNAAISAAFSDRLTEHVATCCPASKSVRADLKFSIKDFRPSYFFLYMMPCGSKCQEVYSHLYSSMQHLYWPLGAVNATWVTCWGKTATKIFHTEKKVTECKLQWDCN